VDKNLLKKDVFIHTIVNMLFTNVGVLQTGIEGYFCGAGKQSRLKGEDL
jgi:hypothetical protein